MDGEVDADASRPALRVRRPESPRGSATRCSRRSPGRCRPRSSAAAHADWATAAKHGRIVGSILELAGGDWATTASKKFARSTRWTREPAAEFHTRYIALPFPGTATEVATGTLPGTGRRARSPGSRTRATSTSSATTSPRSPRPLRPGGQLGRRRGRRHRRLRRGPAGAGRWRSPAPAGYGISTAGRALCVYAKGAGPGTWPSGAEVEKLSARCDEVAGLLG